MPRSLARDHDEKRDVILQAAATVFARDGYDRASMAGVAAEAGVSKALLYHYHASKEALLADVIGRHLEDLVQAVEAADRNGSAEERIGALVSALLDAYRDADAEHRVQIEGLRRLPKAEQERLKALERRLVSVFAEALRALNPAYFEASGTLKPATMSVFGMLNWFYMWFREGGAMSRDDYARLVTRMVTEGVARLP